ncbi:glycosyltransferase [Sphaerospermopsis sp. LEGE 08334]|uniref:glycosyltransferase n=1 Tax=Sphaerospermopsis sp. LEGE 08334 TaxID=1828651 RepID=UPI0028163EDA|nr:glycosyltransferase [Sphaerospermopsis sp. LEGE 08334]
MKIDLVYPSRKIFHDTWNTGKGWVETLKRMKLLNIFFALDPENCHTLLDYLKAPNSDMIIILGGDHFLYFMYDNHAKKDIWDQVKIPKICICWESIVNSLFPGFFKRSSNSLHCFDYFIYGDERDQVFFEGKSVNYCFSPLCVDGQEFKKNKPLHERKNHVFFFGKINNFGIEKVYSERRRLLSELLTNQAIDYISEYMYTGDSAEKLVNLYNEYTLTINLPTNHGGYTQRIYEAMSCGTIIFQYRLKNDPYHSLLFKEYDHYIPYEINNIPELLENFKYYLKHLPDLEYISEKARQEVLAKHTIEARINQILKFVTTGEKIEYQLIPELKQQANLNQQNSYSWTTEIKTSPKPIIIVDGVFFQLYKTGIARVWQSILQEWVKSGFAKHIVLLDRAGTSPDIAGIWYRTIHPYDYNNTEADKQMLQQICKEEGADLFISSYYTTPITTPSVFMAYDMIPEVMGANVNEPMWREKHHAIKHASAYIAISQNTASDLSKYFPNIAVQSITVAHCGVSNTFSPANPLQINTFKHRYGINKPYFLLGGNLADYKNSILFFKAFSKLPNSYEFDIIFTGFGGVFPPELRDYTSGSAVHQLQLSDEELRLAYSGAVALVYPSKYEGFGMPIVEAMACGCPVITCPNSSIPEVAGEAAIYVNDNDVDAMANALISVQNHNLRTSLITAGLAQAQKFSWTKMATQVSSALINTTLLSLKLRDINLIIFPDPTQSEQSIYQDLIKVITALEEHPHSDNITLLINASNFPSQFTQAFMDNLCNQDEEETAGLEISLVGKLSSMQWQTLLPQITARIFLTQEDQQTLEKLPVHQFSSCQVDNLNEQLSILLTESLKQNLRLRNINLIIFPDPTQPEQSIYQDLVNVITALEEHPHSDNITLLINASNFSSQFTQAFMDNLCNQEEEETAGLEISLVGKLSSIQWEALLPQITARIVLNNEDQQALEQVQLEKLTSYQLDNLEDVLKVADGVSNIYRSP